MQLNLIFPETVEPHARLWASLDEETRRAVLERLAELIACAAQAQPATEKSDDE